MVPKSNIDYLGEQVVANDPHMVFNMGDFHHLTDYNLESLGFEQCVHSQMQSERLRKLYSVYPV